MESVELYLKVAREATHGEGKRAALQLATIAAMQELSVQLGEVKALLKEYVATQPGAVPEG